MGAKAPFTIKEKPTWGKWVTPQLLKEKPVHRWYTFPHSFTCELVHELIEEWGLRRNTCILDPFAGAGTTLLAAKEKEVPATGYDLSPLAVMASSTKIANYSLRRLEAAWMTLKRSRSCVGRKKTAYPNLIKQALPGKLLAGFEN